MSDTLKPDEPRHIGVFVSTNPTLAHVDFAPIKVANGREGQELSRRFLAAVHQVADEWRVEHPGEA